MLHGWSPIGSTCRRRFSHLALHVKQNLHLQKEDFNKNQLFKANLKTTPRSPEIPITKYLRFLRRTMKEFVMLISVIYLVCLA